ncbi:MAG: DNA gyrase inhibitor YacG [Anaeromyxobacteraceae bacterium]|nr:DNA gyrase inhibitor YacG [Anaeromyxobacteraceae bacterium]
MAHPCPICRKPVAPRADNRAFPFCSGRCRLLDLGQWLDGGYRVPGERAGDGAAGPARPGDDEEVA